MGHEGKCANVHGHEYVLNVEVAIEGSGDIVLDSVGRILDFGVIKDKVGGWIDDNWDHNFLANEKDLNLIQCINAIQKKDVFVLPYNPTAENLCRYLVENVLPYIKLGRELKVVGLEIEETPRCSASLKIM